MKQSEIDGKNSIKDGREKGKRENGISMKMGKKKEKEGKINATKSENKGILAER